MSRRLDRELGLARYGKNEGIVELNGKGDHAVDDVCPVWCSSSRMDPIAVA